MARKKITVDVCDRCPVNRKLPATETVPFSIDGIPYEIDGCVSHARELRREIDSWAMLGRRVHSEPVHEPWSPFGDPAERKRAAQLREEQWAADRARRSEAVSKVARPVPVQQQRGLEPGEWTLSDHALRKVLSRGYTAVEALKAAVEPETSYRSDSSPDGEERWVHRRGACAVVVSREAKRIISVLHKDQSKYKDDKPLARSAYASA